MFLSSEPRLLGVDSFSVLCTAESPAEYKYSDKASHMTDAVTGRSHSQLGPLWKSGMLLVEQSWLVDFSSTKTAKRLCKHAGDRVENHTKPAFGILKRFMLHFCSGTPGTLVEHAAAAHQA